MALKQHVTVEEVAGPLKVSVGLLVRRLRQLRAEGDLTMPQTSILKRLESSGPTAATALAKAEQISPQSIGATLAGLEERGFIERRPDPADGRRIVISSTRAGLRALLSHRKSRTEAVARALSSGFTPMELDQLATAAPLIERLALSI